MIPTVCGDIGGYSVVKVRGRRLMQWDNGYSIYARCLRFLLLFRQLKLLLYDA